MKKIIVLKLVIICFFFGCTKEETGGGRMSYPSISDEQKELQAKFELIINDEDNYSKNGLSIDTVKIYKLECYSDISCSSIKFYKPSNEVFYLNREDIVVLSNGGLLMKNTAQDSSTIDELFLTNAISHPENYPYLELASIVEGGGSAMISQATIQELVIEERRIELSISGNAIEERVVLGLIEE